MTIFTGQLHYDNAVDKPGVGFETYGSWSIGLANLQDPQIGKVAQTASTALSATKFRCNLGVARTFRGLFLTHTNLSPAAQYRLTLFSDAYATIQPGGQTGWLSIPGYPQEDPDNLGASIWHLFAADRTAQYIECELSDESNPDGFVRASRFFAPRCFKPLHNFAPDGNADTLQPNTELSEAVGGAMYGTRYTPKRSLRINYPNLPESQMAEIRRIRRVAGIDRQVCVIPDPGDVDQFYERNFVGTLKSLPEIALAVRGDGGTGFEIIESVP